jgi:hypothetical protein
MARKMHQTTVRFGPDLWAALERESAEVGVSIAQFVRDSALARLMYLAGQRHDSPYGGSLEAGAASREPPAFEDSAALGAQGRQARRHARELRDSIARQRARS